MRDEWPVWSVIGRLHGGATLREIDTYWSIDDVLDACEYLDVADDVTAWGRAKPSTPSAG